MKASEAIREKRKFAIELKQLVHQKCVEINHYVSGCDSPFSYLQIADVQESLRGISNCLTSVQKDNLVIESQVLTPKRTEYGKQIRKAYESGRIQESRHNMTELEPRKDDISNTLTTVQKDNLLLEKPQYRIRKLTPRECGRLMGVSDEDIDKMAVVNSNTQLYKQFGNSIVVEVMCAMFKNLNIKQGDSNEALQTN